MTKYRVPLVVDGRKRRYLVEAPTEQDAKQKALAIAGQKTHKRPRPSSAVLDGTPELVA